MVKKVGMVSLGCAKNRVDAEKILGGVVARGFELVEDLADAEVLIVNTCGFIREAVEESIEEILAATRLKDEGNLKVLAVSGCLYKRYPEMKGELPEVDHFFTPEEIALIPQVISGTNIPTAPAPAPSRILTAPPHSAYLKIAEGCSNHCKYCTIPAIRGPFHSFDKGALVNEARELAGMGTVELNLVAQDVTAFGSDLGEADGFGELVGDLGRIDGIKWIRLLYSYPGRLGTDLVQLMEQNPKVVPYLDAPIQHAHPRILEAMGRKGGPDELLAYFERLQRGVEGLVLRTTAIVGFPGETEEEFEALLEFVRKVRFHHLGAFVYSPEEGTAAAKLTDRVEEEIAWERHERLMQLQAEISEERNREFVGTEIDVLVEGIDEEGEVVGRTYGQAPEVDGFTRLKDYGDGIVEVGAFVKARVVEALTYDLVAEVTQQEG